MNINDFAERLLTGDTLEDKLFYPEQIGYKDYTALKGAPLNPGRPDNLSFKAAESVPFPKSFEQDIERGQVMHFFANHELLAIELMALALLRFPEAPKAFKVGLLKTIREEQSHMTLYRERMKVLGVEFGSIPVNNYFWNTMKDMQTPMDYVMSLSLLFEQANLDFSKHFLHSFSELGDQDSAKVLQTVYDDEVSHVQFGLHWFRKWKKRDKSDWQAFCEGLKFPLTPIRAKGTYFDVSGRKKAGFDEEFIQELEVFSHSKGRPPNLYYFNPSSENYLATGLSHSPSKMTQALEQDLQDILFLVARKDDIVLTGKKPSRDFLRSLRQLNFELPEFIEIDQSRKEIPRKTLVQRHINKFIPWGYSPDVHKKFAAFKEYFRKHSDELYSKESTLKLREHLGIKGTAHICESLEEVEKHLQSQKDFPVLLKACLSTSGQNHIRIDQEEIEPDQARQIERLLKTQSKVFIEKYHERFADFSALYERQGDKVIFKGITRLVVTNRGQYQGNLVNAHRWDLNPTELRYLYHDCNFLNYYKNLTKKLEIFFQDYPFEGAFGIDFFFYKEDEKMCWQEICELNPRLTMGRLALEAGRRIKKQQPYGFFITKKNSIPVTTIEPNAYKTLLENATILLNDPQKSHKYDCLLTLGQKDLRYLLSSIGK